MKKRKSLYDKVKLKSSKFNSYNTGGLHEENPNGGIPMGMGENGLPNTVEEDETSFEFDDGKYIFSNRLSLYPTKSIEGNQNEFKGGELSRNKVFKKYPGLKK